ncbi:hypothetical protein J1N35_001965 [Gossypium stocksii]|uniref:Rho-GAP domain-containing protein n=1 Tax=Gossypium stocksii TaxID=47602 RepID=A0A9D3WIR4_9ROSI|nr:hypothetical protein J1N35_001965 [Gossypium stocksii]
MTEVLHSSSPPSAENSSSSTTSDDDDDDEGALSCAPQTSLSFAHGNGDGFVNVTGGDPRVEEEGKLKKRSKQDQGDQLSVLALLVTLFRKSWTSGTGRELCGMDIGIPTNVRQVSYVTFDRFRGFLGLPVEFEPEVPTRVPSASANVFGVSTESMQLSYDSRGNSVPAKAFVCSRRLAGFVSCFILSLCSTPLCLHLSGFLLSFIIFDMQAEGIFRITGDNSQVEYVREQLNRGVAPEEIDAHCLAGLIKVHLIPLSSYSLTSQPKRAWFRELPSGVLDSLDPQQVMQCETEEQCTELARLLPPTEYALLDWAIDLMADVVQQEHLNKMNARNIAVVFAPNMTQVSTLISKTLREREYSLLEPTEASYLEPSDDDGEIRGLPSPALHIPKDNEEKETAFIAQEPLRASFANYSQNNETADGEEHSLIPSVYKQISA